MVIIVILIIILAMYVVFNLIKSRRNKKAMTIALETQSNNAQEYFDDLVVKKTIPVVETSIHLKREEEAYLVADVSLIETKSVRVSERIGGAVSIARGVYIGSSTGISRSHEELREIDTGNLTLTNRRLIFSGFQGQRIVEIKKLVSTTIFEDLSAVLICSEGRQKNQIYKGMQNPVLWARLLSVIKEIIEEYGQLSKGTGLSLSEDTHGNNEGHKKNSVPRAEAYEQAVPGNSYEPPKGSNIIRFAGKVCHLSCKGQSYNIRYFQDNEFVVIDSGSIDKLKNISSQITVLEKAPKQAITNVSFWNEYFLSNYSEDRSSQEDT